MRTRSRKTVGRRPPAARQSRSHAGPPPPLPSVPPPASSHLLAPVTPSPTLDPRIHASPDVPITATSPVVASTGAGLITPRRTTSPQSPKRQDQNQGRAQNPGIDQDESMDAASPEVSDPETISVADNRCECGTCEQSGAMLADGWWNTRTSQGGGSGCAHTGSAYPGYGHSHLGAGSVYHGHGSAYPVVAPPHPGPGPALPAFRTASRASSHPATSTASDARAAMVLAPGPRPVFHVDPFRVPLFRRDANGTITLPPLSGVQQQVGQSGSGLRRWVDPTCVITAEELELPPLRTVEDEY